MPYISQSTSRERAQRARFAESIPAVLRFADGRCSSGKLRVVSTTGGLLCVSRPFSQGLTAKLMFLTSAGSVFGAAEILWPVSWELQPFKFVTLHTDDQSRLQAAIASCLQHDRQDRKQVRMDHEQLEKVRAW